MSRKAQGRQLSGALFPFLAVLVCTMGALIVLFVIVVQRGHVESSALASAQTSNRGSEPGQRVRERIEDAQWQREMLEKSRAEKTDELAQARSRVAHLEEHTQRLEAKAKELLERAKAIDEGKKLRDEDMVAAKAEAAKLKAEIDKKKEEIEKAKKNAPDGKEWYALIPYDGRSGTRRRPIYVECTEFGVVIQPEGLRLTTEDFSGPLGPGNPLDSALRAIRDYWERSAGTKAGQPYPLLVVRPSGVVAFGAAKAAIGAWDDEWGYELISDDKNIDFGPPDPGLNATLNKTVNVARQRQAAMIAMMPRRFQGDEPLRSFAPEPTLGVGGSRSIGGGGSGAGGGTGTGSGIGNGTGTSGSGVGNGTGTGGAYGNGKASQAGGGMARGGYGNGLGSGTGASGGGTSQLGYGGSNSGIGGNGFGAGGGYAAGGTNGTGGAGGPGGYGAAGGASSGGNGNALGGNGFGASGANGTSGSGIPSVAAAWNTNNTTGDQRFGAANKNEPGMIGGGGGNGGGDSFSGSQAGGDGSGSGNGAAGPGGSNTGGGAGGYGTGGGQGSAGQYAGSPGGQSAGGAAGGAGGAGGAAGGAGGRQFGSTMGGQSGGGASSGSTSGGAGSPPGGGTTFPFIDPQTGSAAAHMDATTPGGGSSGFNQLPTSGASQRSGAPGPTFGVDSARAGKTKRGRNWALPQAKVNQIGVTRPMHISIEPNRIVMYPERGDNRAPKVVAIAPELSPDDVTHFVDAVQNEVKGWGLAVSDGYWKPVLQADIAPGAERQFMNLETALHGSGIEVTRR